MRYATVCSGIEAASVAWEDLGWVPMFFSEIEPFCNAVLKHHYPNVPNFGDMTKFKEWPTLEIDVLCAGTPCQSFSLAGLRKGLSDPRGNLTLTFLAIIDKYKPKYILWENVPGILSDKTNALKQFLDGLQELGYFLDIDILDAQYFGLAQRRRRIFVCAINGEHLLGQKSVLSASITTQCLAELLHTHLKEGWHRCNTSQENLKYQNHLKDGLQKRMALLKLRTETESGINNLLNCLKDTLLKSLKGQKCSATVSGFLEQEHIEELILSGLGPTQTESIFLNTSLKKRLEEISNQLKSSTTSTLIMPMTELETYTYAKTVLYIGRFISLLSESWGDSSEPCFWNCISSVLTALKECTNYARQTSSNILAGMEWLPVWANFFQEAEPVCQALGNIRIKCFGQIFSVEQGLSGDIAPSEEEGEGTARGLANSIRGSGPGTARTEDTRGQDNIVSCHQNTGQGWWKESATAQTIRSGDGKGGGEALRANLVSSCECLDGQNAAAIGDKCGILQGEGLKRQNRGFMVADKPDKARKKGSHWDGTNIHPTFDATTSKASGRGQSDQELFSQRGAGLVPDKSGAIKSRDHKGPSSNVQTDGAALIVACPPPKEPK